MLHGDRQNAIFNFNTKQINIGRADSCTIVLNDRQISKQHAAISFQDNDYWIDDMNSTNGVFINGRKMTNRKRIFHGCIIKLGTPGILYCI